NRNFPASCFSLSDLPPDVVAHAMDVVHAAGITDPTIAAEAAYDYIFTGSPTYVTGGEGIQQQGFTGTPATITMEAPPTAVGIAATQPKFTENPSGPTQATFTVFLTAAAAADTVIDYSVVAPDATFLGASAFGGTLPSGQVTILAGQKSAQLTIDVPNGALGSLPSENLEVKITAPNGVVPIAPQADTEIVNNEPGEGAPAVPALAFLGHVGTFTHNGNNYTLDLGGLTQGELIDPLQFAVVNDATAPADNVSGTFGVPTGNGFTVIGNNLAGPIQPGGSYQGLFFTTQTNVTGPHSETLVFHPTDVNDSGFNNELSDITLTVTDTVAPPAQAELNSPDRITFPNVRGGTPEDQPPSITNGAGEGARSLDVSPVATPAATVTGSISLLAPGATDYTDIRVGLDTSQAGARSGYVTLNA